MYRPPKNNESAQQQQQRIKLELMSTMPTVKQVRAQFEEGSSKRGTIVEQQWSTGKPHQLFNLMVQWDKGADNPIWTFYEENGADSKMHWSQPFAPSDIEMLYDILAMTTEAGAQGSAKIPDSLKPKESPYMAGDKGQAGGGGGGLSGSFLGNRASQMPAPMPMEAAPAPAPQAAPNYPPPAPPAPAYAPAPQPAPAYQQPPQNYPPPAPAYPPPAQPQAPYPPQGYAQQQPPQGYPQQQQPPQGYPPQPQAPQGYPPQQPPAQAQAGYPNDPYAQYQAPPQGYPPQQPTPQGYPPQQPAPASIWQTGHNMPAQAPPSGALPPELSPVKGGGRSMDYELSPRGTNILLGTLLFESGMINKPTLDAALKIQDMVREERISIADAPENLKRLHDMGASIEQYVTKTEGNRKPKPEPGPSRSGPTSEQASEQRAVFDLLQKAGLLKEEDLKSASTVRNKHGGDMVQILQAAGKMDPTTWKAACMCIPLIRDNKMKIEQCIIAVNYCNRSRVDFDTALEELNWPNPLK